MSGSQLKAGSESSEPYTVGFAGHQLVPKLARVVGGQRSLLDSRSSSSSPEATSMMLVGCPRCLVYAMLSEDDPKCKSTVLLDLQGQYEVNNRKSSSRRRKRS
ncbi:hypothetical protein SAY87_027847 [Trapa incisa]|uniref:GIR1-like zinc ribbon domain-containing protein n=1 Tax=Trapa incisa TaxID=236973 RepID=A0AAN7KNG0_9MYRT|nr:hypothetical protein SAY87_027847 [Trapa incisa]